MNEQQKIELGTEIAEIVSHALHMTAILPSSAILIDFADCALSKIKELESSEPMEYRTEEKLHVCGCCYQTYPVDELERDFMTCSECASSGKIRPACFDKRGVMFTAGDILKNENSAAAVQILQIQESHIVSDIGCIKKQEFLNIWIVHEPITEFLVNPINDDVEACVTQCEFMPAKIGSIDCSDCDHHKGYNEDQQWVICELYNKENEDEI